MKIIGVIPARYASSRFPGKPLADIHGKPMIWWTYQNAKKVECLPEIYVALDDKRIADVCKTLGIPYVLTSSNHLTGVDRLAEVSQKIPADRYILIQGDEPLLETATITSLVTKSSEMEDSIVLTFKTPITNPVDVVNCTIIKIVTAPNNDVLFASRSPIPYPKDSLKITYYKSVGVYSYPFSVLKNFPALQQGPLEFAEGHDFMRLLENGIRIQAFPYQTSTISVDTPKDLERVKAMLGSAIPRRGICK